MRKIIIILLSGIYLFANTEVAELFKVPQLISHFFQHHRQNISMGFCEFLAGHYGGDDGTSADDDQDNRLPYHDIQHHNTFSSLFYSMDNETPSIDLPDYNGKKFGDCLLAHYPPRHGMLVIQPPRIA